MYIDLYSLLSAEEMDPVPRVKRGELFWVEKPIPGGGREERGWGLRKGWWFSAAKGGEREGVVVDFAGFWGGFAKEGSPDVFAAVAVVISTGFLERFLPLCMCFSQYFDSGNASFEHLHFFPSVLLHLPGSGSAFLPQPIWKQPHPTAEIKIFFCKNRAQIRFPTQNIQYTTKINRPVERERERQGAVKVESRKKETQMKISYWDVWGRALVELEC